ncbi:Beta-galactosidase C-terminal domain [Microbacterium amylolyticum]
MDGVEALLPVLLPRAGVESELPQALRGRVELVTREGDRRYDFLINRTDDELSLAGLTGEYLVGTETLPPRGVAVLAR